MASQFKKEKSGWGIPLLAFLLGFFSLLTLILSFPITKENENLGNVIVALIVLGHAFLFYARKRIGLISWSLLSVVVMVDLVVSYFLKRQSESGLADGIKTEAPFMIMAIILYLIIQLPIFFILLRNKASFR